MNEIGSKPESNRHSYASTASTEEPVSSCSSTLINSELAYSSSPLQHLPYPPYPYPYGYPWYPPPPNQMPVEYSENGLGANWHYPYVMHSHSPPPPPPTSVSNSSTSAQTNPTLAHYPPYPFFYPYYPPLPPHMPPHSSHQNATNTLDQTSEFDWQTMYPSYMPPPSSYLAYPYAEAVRNSKRSGLSRASSVLPDIIITPSTDDVPSQFIKNQYTKIEKRPSFKRANSLEPSFKSNCSDAKVTAIDSFAQHLQNISKCMENNLNSKGQAKKSYKKNIEQKSPEENTSPVQNAIMKESENSFDTDMSDSDVTPKQIDTNRPASLISIKSVNNVHIYKNQKIPQEDEKVSSSETETDEDDDDETTADGESDVFDEEEDEEQYHNDYQEEDLESEELIVDDDLSIIYEEESEIEKTSDIVNTVIQGDKSSKSGENKNIEEQDKKYAEEQERDESTSVTVRLPLKFSFSTSEDAENIATLEVGKSEIAEKHNTTISASEKSNSFSVATIKSDSEDNGDDTYDECDVSVTISLTNSSKSNSLESKVGSKNITDLHFKEANSLNESSLEDIEKSQEDISVSFSLNMRNKFASETIKGDLTNNISLLEESERKPKKEEDQKMSGVAEEFDFFATLMATKIQAQKVKEQSANYWGKSKEENHKTEEIQDTQDIQKENIEEQQYNTKDKETKINSLHTYSNKSKTLHSLEKVDKPKKNCCQPENKETKLHTNQSKEPTLLKKEIKAENKLNKLKEFEAGIAEAKTSGTYFSKTESDEDQVQQEIKKPKFSFWERCSTTSKEEKVQLKETRVLSDSYSTQHICSPTVEKKIKSQKTEGTQKRYTKKTKKEEKKKVVDPTLSILKTNEKSKETADLTAFKETKIEKVKSKKMDVIWVQQEEKEAVKKTLFSRLNNSNVKEIETSSDAQQTEELEDIWADRVDDLPPIKSIKTKLKPLEIAKKSFWSSVSEANKTFIANEQNTQAETKNHLPPPDTIIRNKFDTQILNCFVMEIPQSQIATVHHEEKVIEEPSELEEEEVDFWAEIEKAKENNSKPSYINDFKEKQKSLPETNYINSFREPEMNMYNDYILSNNESEFDPLKYPEEPREVDTDEEIDFWAEIEAKRQSEEDNITFNKSASFWASRERDNTMDETPYKPLLPKAFDATLPDEPEAIDINIWKTLEAHKGEEPVIIDPVMEEEKALAQQYDKMIEDEREEEKKEHSDDGVLVYGTAVASMWCPLAQLNQLDEQEVKQETETDFSAQIKRKQEISQEKPEANQKSNVEQDEVEIKRSNYRKAMAFFTTSIDDNKEQGTERYERSKSKSKRSSYIEEESEQWDWDAVNEALQQDKNDKQSENTVETVEASVKEIFDKELTPQMTLSITNTREKTPLQEVYDKPVTKRLSNGLPDLEVNKFNEERKISVKDRISAFETGAIEKPALDTRKSSMHNQSLSVESYTRQSSLSRNSSTQRSESEMDEDDSGVTDMNKQLSETDTESESFPELRKMSSYQRASTHSRLFKLLQEDPDVAENNQNDEDVQCTPSRRKIVHNVSITRKQNPNALAEAETMSQRRERLSLPLFKNTSIDADNPSTPNSPASPILANNDNNSSVVSDKLVNELVQSLLLKSDSTQFRKLPMEKLQAAAKRVLEEELDSLKDTSLESNPTVAPKDMKKEKSYAEYYKTWSDDKDSDIIVPSKSFRALQDTRRSSSIARCPRVLSSKTVNRDLARVTESPEISMRISKSPECLRQLRESSIGKWRKL